MSKLTALRKLQLHIPFLWQQHLKCTFPISSIYSGNLRSVVNGRPVGFIHIPKSAGLSLVAALNIRPPGHFPFSCFERVLSRHECEETFFFSFVRHPVDRLLSAYFYLKSGGGGEYDRAMSAYLNERYPTIDLLVREGLHDRVVSQFIHFIPQHEFLSSHKGDLEVNFVGRYETLNDDFVELCKRLRCVAFLPRLNVTDVVAKEGILDSSARRMVEDFYHADMQRFEY